MPSLASLANIPGYGAYIAKRQMNEQQGMQDLQQASTLLWIKNAIEQQQKLRTTTARQSAIEKEMAAAQTPEERRAIAMKYASPDAILRATQPDKHTSSR